MKRNSQLRYFKNIIVNGTEKQQTFLLLIIACLNIFATIIVFRTNWSGDTTSYFTAGENFFNGRIDSFRTPIYPLICAISVRITTHYTIILVALQILAYLISIPFLYKIARMMIRNSAISFITSAIYAALPCFSVWVYALMTEMYALTGSIILTYFFLHFLLKSDRKSVWASSITYTLLVLLRPAFIFLFPALLFFLIYGSCQKRKNYVSFALSLILPIIVYLGYCSAYKNTYGIFTTSKVGSINQWEILKQAKILDLDNIDQSLKNKYIDTLADGTILTDTITIRINSSPLQLQQTVGENISKYKREYISNCLYKLIHLSSEQCFGVGSNNRITSIAGLTIRTTTALSPTFGMLYVVLLFYMIVILREWRNSHLPLLTTYIWLFVSGMSITCIAGAQAEYTRLLLPCTPLILILFSMIIDKLNIQSFQSILKGYY